MGNSVQREKGTEEERGTFFRRAKLIAEAKKVQRRRSPIIVLPSSTNSEAPIRLTNSRSPLSPSSSQDNQSPSHAGEEYAKYGRARRSFQYLGADAILDSDGSDFERERRRSRHSLTYTDTTDAWKLLRGDVDLKDPDEAEAALNVTTIAMGNFNDPDIDPSTLQPSVSVDEEDDPDIPLLIPPDRIPKPEEFCSVCQIEIPNYPLHPCRVCLKQYHESCFLHTAGHVVTTEGLGSFRLANSDTG